jgi:hypothetical protein
MAAFQVLVRGLRKAEQQLEKQLAGIRSAIASLEFGSYAPMQAPPGRRRGRPRGSGRKAGRPAGKDRRKMSAKARAAISRAQKKRWAKQREQQK